MGNFTELQNSGLAIKELKYKQGKVLNSEVVWWALDLDLKRIGKAQQGICAALAMAYLSDILAGSLSAVLGPLINIYASDMTRFGRNKGVASASNKTDQNIAANLVPDQEKLGAAWAADWMEATRGLARNHKLDFTFIYTLNADFLKGWKGKLTKGVPVWVKYDLTVGGKPGAHAVGVIQFDSGIHFFDPNIGGYRIDPKNFDAFISKYLDLLKSKFSWEYKSGDAIFLKRVL